MTVRARPDSLASAARKVAEAARLPWAVVKRSYNALQATDVLPTSRGRSILLAHPNTIGKLLIAVALNGEDALAQRVIAFHLAVARGGDRRFRDELDQMLTKATSAAAVDTIVFEVDVGRVVVTSAGASLSFNAKPKTGACDLAESPLIQWRGVVPGDVVRALQASIKWPASVVHQSRGGSADL